MSGLLATVTSLVGALRPASFRGVSFGVTASGKDGGRRIVTHVYPLRDQVQHEDLGRKERILTVSLFLVGTGIAARAKRLEAALDKPGVGRLVHPLYGEVQVTVISWRMTSGMELGLLGYEASFGVYDGPKKLPAGTSSGVLDRLGLAATAELISDASRLVSLDGLQEFVGESFGETLGAVAGGLSVVAAGYGLSQQVAGTLALLADWTAPAASAATRATGAVTLVTTAVAAVGQAGQRPDALLAIAAGAASPSQPQATADTPSRRAEALNAKVVDEVLRGSAAIAAARLGDTVTWPSRDDAIAARDSVADALDASADRLGALGLDAAWRSIVDLRAGWVRSMTAAAAPLPRIISVTPSLPISSVALAYQLDGDALGSVVERAADIARRNGVSHPGFLAAGAALEVLTDE